MTQPTMNHYGTAAISDFIGDSVVYRNLQPMNPVLPGLSSLRDELGIAPGITP